MERSTIFTTSKIKPKNATLVVGLPGIGSVGSLVGEHLRATLKAKRFATLYSPHFPHQAIMLKSGKMRLVSNRFYYWKNTSKAKNSGDLVILVGDFQALTSEGQYEVNDKIVKFAKKLNCKRILTIGGYNLGNGKFSEERRVFAVTTDKSNMQSLKESGVIFGEAHGMIWGSAGLITAFAEKYNISSACVMGETAGFLDIDAASAKSVLAVLSKLFEIEIDLVAIDKIKKETEAMLKQMQENANAEQQLPSKENFTYIR